MIKKILVIFAIAGFILISFGFSTACAAPVGNIAKPAILKSAMITPDKENAWIGIIGEGEADFTFDRLTKGDDDEMELYFLAQKLGIVFADKFIVYGLVGGTWFEEQFIDQERLVEIETEKDIGWGLGATLFLYEKEIKKLDNSILRFGLDGRFRSTKPDLKTVLLNDVEYKLPHDLVTSKDFKYEDWQIAAEVSLQWKSFIPYLGIKYSDLDASAELTVSGITYKCNDIEAKKNIGVFLGIDILVLDCISYNVEGRFIDEEALTLSGTIRF